MGPFSGVRVVDLRHVLNGPFSTMLLANLGAEVIEIEPRSGDRFRHSWMPVDADHDGYEFLVVNANKKWVTLDLKHERGKAILTDLVRKSDVVVENVSLGPLQARRSAAPWVRHVSLAAHPGQTVGPVCARHGPSRTDRGTTIG